MAAKKKKKAKTSAKAGAAKKKPSKAKKAPAKKAKAKTPTKKAKKPAKKTVKAAAKKAPAKKTKAVAAKKTAPARKKKQIVGEGDYAASKVFLKDQSSFVEKNKARIPALGLEAEKALDGPEGDSLREAEATAAARSRDTF
jgi:hypothetical protein